MNKELLQAVANELRVFDDSGNTRINMAVPFRKERCGTVCCLAGYVVSTRCPTSTMMREHPAGDGIEESWDYIAALASSALGLNNVQASALFLGSLEFSLASKVGTAQVADAIERMLAGLFPWDPVQYRWAAFFAAEVAEKHRLAEVFPNQHWGFMGGGDYE